MICKSKPKFVLYLKKPNRSWCDMRQRALWIHTGREEREFGNSGPSDPHVSPGKSLERREGGTGRAGDCAESREQPGATGASPEGKGKGKEELIKSALIQKRASKYWINVKTPRVGRERPLPNEKQSPVLHVNTFLQDSQRQLVQVKNNKD